MTKPVNQLEILAIGLDSFSGESIKRSLKLNRIKYHITFIQDVLDLENFRKTVHAVFFFSNRQSQKTIDDIRKIQQHLPRVAITLLSPRPDTHGVVSAFRAGLFDFLTLPLEENEIRTVLYRLKLHGAIQSGEMTPERAVLQFFSRPESFSSVSGVSRAVTQYLNLFLKVEKAIQFSADDRIIVSMQRKLKLTEHQTKRIKRFLADNSGIIFGLRFVDDLFYFLVKNGEGKLCYMVAKNTSPFTIKEILSDYLSNVLRTSVSILAESKNRENMRILSMTDDVTGLYNQRKLIEDLEYHVSRYQMDKSGFSLLFVDIDYFKTVNDQWGHVVGSQLLIDMAKIVRAQLRGSDLVYRYGGDEFIVLLPRTPVDEAKKIALRISDAVKAAEFVINSEKKHRLSLSIGVADFPSDADSAKSIIDFADKMMYMSKKSGRGKVFHVTEVVA